MRTPYNIHLYLYRKNENGFYEYAIFQRSDYPEYWQGVAGGVEEGETLLEAVKRECKEEAGVLNHAKIYKLDMVSYMPATLFSEHKFWEKDRFLCPMYYFAMPYDGEIILSDEHLAAEWLTYQQAKPRIYWQVQQTALWELKQRLKTNQMVIAKDRILPWQKRQSEC